LSGRSRKAVEHGIRAGELLTEAKGNCEHSILLPWLKETFKGAARTALVGEEPGALILPAQLLSFTAANIYLLALQGA
jgi:hypothetical protein